MSRVLRLTKPYMVGEDIRVVQRALHVKADGEYGPVTGSAAAAWKYRAGYPEERINTGMGEVAQDLLLGRARLPKDYLKRAQKRRKDGYFAGHGMPDIAVQVKALARMEAWAAARYKEEPAGSNKVPQLIAEGRRLGVGAAGMGYPWCAYAVMLALLGAGSKTAKDGLKDGKFNALYVPEIFALAQAGKFGMRLVSRDQALPGDLVIFNWDGGVADHIGMLRQPGQGDDDTVEGNTSYSDLGSQSNGGAMALRTRTHKFIQAYVRAS